MDLVKCLFKYGHSEADRSTVFSCLSVHKFRFISVSVQVSHWGKKRRRETERDGMKTREGVGEREREGVKERVRGEGGERGRER